MIIMATAADVMKIAVGELGYCRWDDPLNGTKYGREYAQLVNDSSFGNNGVAYCAMFVTYCIRHAGATAPGIPGAYCPWIVTAGIKAGRTISNQDAQYGDMVLFDWEGDGVSDHIGFVESNNVNAKVLTCIEGNTTGADGRSGSVARRTRAYSTVICIIRPYYDNNNSNSNPTWSTLNGIDIASWEKGINLANVPCDFVIVKATGGKSYVNPEFKNQYTQAMNLGKCVGYYHFANESNRAGTAYEEAQFFLNQTKDYAKTGIPVLDWENDVNRGVNYAKEWLDIVYNAIGVKPFIYMSKSVCRNFDWSPVVNAGYQLWCAQYPNYNTVNGYNTSPWTDNKGFGAWKEPKIFQYTENGRLSGWNGDLDLNIFYGDIGQWNTYAGKDTKLEPQIERYMTVENYSNSGAQKWWLRTEKDGTNALRSYANYEWLSDPYSSTVEYNAMLYGGTDGNVDPRPPQILLFEKIEDDYSNMYIIHPKVADGLSLTAGDTIRWKPNDGSPQQKWIFKRNDDNTYNVISAATMKALAVKNGGWA